ncbi:Mob1/phocein, partial [Cucurbitaria berberidis CBS 394.84]
MASPASPRLPSPPPIPEDQLSPVSASAEQQKLFSNLDNAAARRIRPGTKAEDMAEGPPLVELSEIDSAFQLTEHLKALHYFLTHPIGANTTIPVDSEMAHKLAQSPDNVDKTLWLYELCRFLIQKVNSIIVALFADNPPCSSTTCPEMRASEWQYLCAVHDPPKSCCAIDYCCHTLDWAANTLTSPKHFPSRLALGTDQSTQHSQMRQLTNIFRRVYRIFAHAWFQHRDMFWKVEGRTGLYVFFKTVCDIYGLIPEDNYTIPPEAEGIEPPTEPRISILPSILKREPSEPGPQDLDNSTLVEGVTDNTLSTAGTTKRHRNSPSVGATSVTTVVEESEEEEERPTQPRPVTQIFESAPEEEDSTILDEPEKADDEDGPQEAEEKLEDPATKQESADTSKTEVADVKAAEIEAPEAESKGTGEDQEEQQEAESKPDAVESKADDPESA